MNKDDAELPGQGKPEGVSISFFVAATKHLTKTHGDRLCQVPGFEAFRAALARAETLWKSLPKAGGSPDA